MNPEQQAKLNGQIRHLLTFGAGYLVASGKISEAEVAPLVGVGTALIGFVWSWRQKNALRAAQPRPDNSGAERP